MSAHQQRHVAGTDNGKAGIQLLLVIMNFGNIAFLVGEDGIFRDDNVVVFGILICVLVFRPSGILGARVAEKV